MKSISMQNRESRGVLSVSQKGLKWKAKEPKASVWKISANVSKGLKCYQTHSKCSRKRREKREERRRITLRISGKISQYQKRANRREVVEKEEVSFIMEKEFIEEEKEGKKREKPSFPNWFEISPPKGSATRRRRAKSISERKGEESKSEEGVFHQRSKKKKNHRLKKNRGKPYNHQ